MVVLILLMIYGAVIVHGHLAFLDVSEKKRIYQHLEEPREDLPWLKRCFTEVKLGIFMAYVKIDAFCVMRYINFNRLVNKIIRSLK